ncbi:MAG: hypothetical protein K2X35_20160 [Bryobacteraceae bacterium]|nr:hypothetical protein [Bryobacteraceae bacterium]
MTRRLTFLAAIVALTCPAASLTPEESKLWRADLRFLADKIVATHPNPFKRISRDAFERLVSDLDARIPSLDREKVIAGLVQVISSLRDGHTALAPFRDPAARFSTVPADFYWFEDGLFIHRAADADLLGARVLRVGATPVEKLADAIAPLVDADNRFTLLARAPARLRSPEMLYGAGLIPDAAGIPMELEKNGRRFEIVLKPRAAGTLQSWRDESNPPLYLSRTETHWFTYLPDRRMMYVSMSAILDSHGETMAAFFRRALAEAASKNAGKFVLDLRNNGGGNNTLVRPLIIDLIRSQFNERDKLFVLIGRRTFSAAMNFVNLLELFTNATFVGEPTGASPNHYGDATGFQLPNSKLNFRVSTLLWQDQHPLDRREYLGPHIAVDLTSAAYARNLDPVLDAVHAYQPVPPVIETLRPLVEKGEWDAARKTILEYRSNPAFKYRPLENRLNDYGYQLMNRGDLTTAIGVLRLNSLAYPESANVHDSLGEALARAGKTEEAIASYRRALAIQPSSASAAAAIERLQAPRK